MMMPDSVLNVMLIKSPDNHKVIVKVKLVNSIFKVAFPTVVFSMFFQHVPDQDIRFLSVYLKLNRRYQAVSPITPNSLKCRRATAIKYYIILGQLQ